jgi:calcium-translocating P-type ATPase
VRPAYALIALRQVTDPLVGLLVAASAVSFAIGDGIEAAAIAAIVAVNAALGFLQEAQSARAVLALRESVLETASVVREGREREVPFDDVVPGDLVLLREGDRVPADARLVRAAGLELDEAPLTGESLPEGKSTEPVPAATPLADRTSMVYAGTGVTRGRGAALVTATGGETEIGRIVALTAEARRPPTPLQRRLAGLTRAMVAAGVALTLVLGGAMLARGSSLHEAFLVGVSVAVAAVPEGLVAALTVALALGARSMAARGAIVRELSAIETIGETTVICTDKTGTLTENRLRVAAAVPAAGRTMDELLGAAVLASTAELAEDGRVAGDPVEGALLLAARERDLTRLGLTAALSLIREIPFEPARKRMTLLYEDGAERLAAVKGAPEVVLERSLLEGAERRRLEEEARAFAEDGLRVLAVAERRLPAGVEPDDDELERGLEPLGLVALHDPLRPAAPGALREAQAAGIEVRMLTGDHPATAKAVGRALGLPEEAVFARVTPADKLALVERLQDEGEVVTVTGDGVNDAPALRAADVGVAMGRSGTEAAREAADVVLTDDNFATIVAAVREGRAISDNIRKFVAFLLSANLGEVVLFGVAVLAGLGAPMTVVQMLAVNVLTDGLPAIALSRDPASADTMTRPPYREGRLLPGRVWLALGGAGALVGVAALGAFLAGRALGGGVAQTMAFATIALAQLVFVFSCRSVTEPALAGPRNRLLLLGVAASAGLLALAVYLPPLGDPFATVPLGAAEAGIVLGFALVPFACAEGAKALRRRIRPAP